MFSLEDLKNRKDIKIELNQLSALFLYLFFNFYKL